LEVGGPRVQLEEGGTSTELCQDSLETHGLRHHGCESISFHILEQSIIAKCDEIVDKCCYHKIGPKGVFETKETLTWCVADVLRSSSQSSAPWLTLMCSLISTSARNPSTTETIGGIS